MTNETEQLREALRRLRRPEPVDLEYGRTLEVYTDDLVELIEGQTKQAVITELKKIYVAYIRTYRQTVTDNQGSFYVDESYSYISEYGYQERIAELESQLKKSSNSELLKDGDA